MTNNAIIVSLTDPNFIQVATATSTRTGITYTSSETDIATVNKDSGEVTILAPGLTTITATLAADETYNEATVTYTLTVNDPNKQTDTLTFTNVTNNVVMQAFDMAASTFTQVVTAMSPRTGITYSSSEMDIATINASSGEVTILAPGITTITATLAADETYNVATATYTLIVNDPNKQTDILTFTNVTNNAVMVSLTDPSFIQVATSTSPRTGIIYSSSRASVATVSSSGEVTIQAAGTTMIIATIDVDATYNVAIASYTLTVAKGDDTLTFIDVTNNAVMQVLGASNFTQVATATSARTEIAYTSSRASVATVDSSSGEVTIVGAGSTTITATLAENTNYNEATAAIYTLTVAKGDDTLTFIDVTNNAVMQVLGASNFTQVATATSARTEIAYTSNTPGVATVHPSSGEVTIQAAGTTTITATLAENTNYNEATESYTLTVIKGTETLTFASTFTSQMGNPDLFLSGNGSVSVLDGSNLSFARIASSPNATGTITYGPSSDTSVATVTATGVVTIVATGKTTITANRASDANYNAATASYTLIVADPIETANELKNIDLDGHYALTANIELSEDAWRPIGNVAGKFTGSFNGRDFKISNLNITSDLDTNIGHIYAGLFGFIENASISNLGVVAGNISSFPLTGYSGALVGVAQNSSISNSYVEITGNISNSNYAGALVGYALENSSISNSYAVITDDISASSFAGGLLGLAHNTPISNSYVDLRANISATGGQLQVGGLIGLADNSPISNSYAVVTGNISATSPFSDANAGGLVGDAIDSLISNSYADVTGSISAHVTSPSMSAMDGNAIASDAISGYAAGLIGRANNSPTSNSYAKITGNISASSMPVQGRQAGSTAAGLVGLAANSSTSNSYAVVNGNISSMTAHSSAAGLIGRAFGASPVRNSYAIVMGTISGSSHYTGGLVGYIDSRSRSPINNSYYNASPSEGNSFGTSQTLVQLRALTADTATGWTAFYDADSTGKCACLDHR